MSETYISFYLRVGRIYIYIDALRRIGCPTRICFMLDDKGDYLIVRPYEKRDLKSHAVSMNNYYGGKPNVRISSIKMCRVLASLRGWDQNYSYRIPGKAYTKENVVMFDLRRAEKTERP